MAFFSSVRQAIVPMAYAYDHQGRILSCEHATSRVTRDDGEGNSEILADHFDGKELNSPN